LKDASAAALEQFLASQVDGESAAALDHKRLQQLTWAVGSLRACLDGATLPALTEADLELPVSKKKQPVKHDKGSDAAEDAETAAAGDAAALLRAAPNLTTLRLLSPLPVRLHTSRALDVGCASGYARLVCVALTAPEQKGGGKQAVAEWARALLDSLAALRPWRLPSLRFLAVSRGTGTGPRHQIAVDGAARCVRLPAALQHELDKAAEEGKETQSS
jgi:hypothetical protein